MRLRNKSRTENTPQEKKQEPYIDKKKVVDADFEEIK